MSAEESSRAIAMLLQDRREVFREVELAQSPSERDRHFDEWKRLTHEIEALQA